jgi:oxygen-dependent protoporphyrinogen oxidase
LKRGLSSLVDTLTTQLSSSMRVIQGEAEELQRDTPDSPWRIRIAGNWIEASQVVLATPAYAAAALLRPHDQESARLLETVPYASSMTVALGFRPGRIPQALKGFGFLVPKVEGRRLRALTVVQNKFPNRAPEGYTLLRCFLGGIGREAVLAESDATILEEVRSDIREMLGVEAEPDYARVIRWHRSMAQYLLGHTYRMRTAQERVGKLGGIYLAGNAYSGIGIPDCVRTGKLAAEAIVAASS